MLCKVELLALLKNDHSGKVTGYFYDRLNKILLMYQLNWEDNTSVQDSDTVSLLYSQKNWANFVELDLHQELGCITRYQQLKVYTSIKNAIVYAQTNLLPIAIHEKLLQTHGIRVTKQLIAEIQQC